MTADPADRIFPIFRRGEQRDEILGSFRVLLRTLVNPDTGETFSEDEIAAATAPGTRDYDEADGIDLVLMAAQNRAVFLADQVDPRTSSTEFLDEYHGSLHGLPRLEATGASGVMTLENVTPGTEHTGSTTIGDEDADYYVSPGGLRFQVLYDATTDGTGITSLQVKAIDVGTATNIPAGTVLTKARGPAGVTEPGEADDDFRGGTDDERDDEYGIRIADQIAHKPASGNWAHFRAWAREASNSVEDAFVYPCALHAGSVIVCIVQKRGTATGPYARQASVGTLADVTAYLTPPGSTVVPGDPAVLVVTWNESDANVVLRLDMPKESDAGWVDPVPWPQSDDGATAASITALASQTSWTLTRQTGSDDLPSGVTAPSLMAWNAATSRWVSLDVQSVVVLGANTFTVTLATAPSFTLAVGTYVSADANNRDAIAEVIEEYFDSLGPGEVVDLDNDPRAHRAMRFPLPTEKWPQRAGANLGTYLADGLQSALGDYSIDTISVQTPPVPSNPASGPSQIVPKRVAIYAL